jgi:site-specific DNA-methyltransferase (adenine-specific)
MNNETVDLIYLDPPFNTKRMFSAPIGSKAAGASFKDMWTWKDVDEYYLETLADKFPALAKYIASVGTLHGKPMMAYLTYMVQRIIEMHRILKETGSLYLHCDPTASHYLKNLLDGIFGRRNFVNEIVWGYSNSGRSKIGFSRKHDTILFYCKDTKHIFWNEKFKMPYSESYLASHFRDKDKRGNVCRKRFDAGKWRVYYPDAGMIPNDWWGDIPSLNSQAKERTGYPTQKPLMLLERIIKASSNTGDIVLDPFCGCATTCVAAQRLGRKWIGIDLETNVVNILVERLTDASGVLFKDFTATDQIPQRTDVQMIPPSEPVKQRLYKQQDGKCKGCGEDFKIWNLEIDHIIPKNKGGGDYYENYQLLCANCNRIKGDRPMEFLRLKIETREKMMKTKIVFGE